MSAPIQPVAADSHHATAMRPVEFPMSHSEDSRAMAARWFTRNLDAPLSPLDQQAFAKWLDESAEHRAEYATLDRVWQVAGAIDPACLRGLVDSTPTTDMPDRRRLGGAKAWQAAVIGLCATLVIGACWLAWPPGTVEHSTAMRAIGNGEYRTVPNPASVQHSRLRMARASRSIPARA